MQSRFVTSASNPTEIESAALPKDTRVAPRPEFAFVGRSNVGKSSLLNRLVGARIARTSKDPGRTQTLNFFEIAPDKGSEFLLVDCPGYGFAKVSKTQRSEWTNLLESYLLRRRNLKAALLLVDLRHPPTDEDVEVFQWLADERRASRTVLVVGTKCDKLPKAKRKPAARDLAAALGVDIDQVIPTSSDTGEGISDLMRVILTLVREGVGQLSGDQAKAR